MKKLLLPLLLCTPLLVAATPAVAAPTANRSASYSAPAMTAGRASSSAAGVGRALTAAQRQPVRDLVHTVASRPPDSHGLVQSVAAACTPGDFGSRTGSALVTFIKASTVDCVNTLFSVTGTNAYNIFREAQMVTVANALRTTASTYPGNNSTSAEQLVLFLRAGYYVQFYHPGDVGTYGATLKTAIRSALDAFFANPRSQDVTDANGVTLTDAVILIDSSGENARYLYVVKRLLNAFDSSYNALWYMRNAVNGVFTVLWRGQYLADYKAAVIADPSITDVLESFIRRQMGLLGTTSGFLVANAGGELSRFLGITQLQSKVRPQVKAVLGLSSMTGVTAPLWVRVADVTDSYDAANCAYYGICNFRAQLAASVLPINHTCSSAIRIRAQQMSSSELSSTCASLASQVGYFHNLVKSNGTPVANDYNSTLEVVTFDSSSDYQTYSGVLFGNDTNNGGMYLEGDPSVVGNIPRFLSYEAEWLRPVFAIWNLNHEFTHYLDGRFNMWGDFGDSISVANIWWIEGFAEYVSYSYRGVAYDAAITEAAKHTYALSTLWNTTYENSDSTRVYRWGYLASRYMMEKHPNDVYSMLGYFRTGNYTAGRNVYASTIGTRYDADFDAWLYTLTGGTPSLPECTGADTRQLDRNCKRSNASAATGNLSYFYIYLPAGVTTLTIKSSGGTGNADLYYNANSWATSTSYTQRSVSSGNTESITVSNPAAGYRYISLYATTTFSGVTVTTQY